MTLRPYGMLFIRLVLLLTGGSLSRAAHADRIVLAPDGAALAPKGFKTEFAITPYGSGHNLTWFQVATSKGLEVETQILDIAASNRTLYALNVQYPIFADFGPLPAISVGVRDLTGTGTEHRSFYVAASRVLPLSDSQVKWTREFRISAGYGTERLDGLFIGMHARLKAGLSVDAEYYRRHPNVSVSLPLVRNMQARAYSLDGSIYYGVSYTLTR